VSPQSKTAFILAGGGSRGAYQAGCLRRLEDEGIEPGLIVGSSIGVCNSLVYATSGAEALWEFWSRTVSLPHVLTPSLRRNALLGNSLFSMDGLIRLIEREVDFHRCFHSETELTYILANLSEGHEELRGNRTETDVDRFRTVTRIGYSIPILHPLIELDGDLYADGGFLWNVPFEHAEDWGAEEIYILSVVPSELPRAGSLRLLPQVAMRMYDVLWRTLGNVSLLEKHLEEGRWHGIDVTVLEPGHETGMFDPLGMLNAHPAKSKRLLWQGYRDTDEVLRAGRARHGRVKGAESPEPARPAGSDAGEARGSEDGASARRGGGAKARRGQGDGARASARGRRSARN
jgi:predicted acylesterase/phospholipase RssA